MILAIVFLLIFGTGANASGEVDALENKIIQEIVAEYETVCKNHDSSLISDGDEIYILTTQQNKKATVVHAFFECANLGHLWCGTMGCPFDVLIEGKRYSPKLLRHKLNYISVHNSDYVFRSGARISKE